mgnify:CR=1 FL=1
MREKSQFLREKVPDMTSVLETYFQACSITVDVRAHSIIADLNISSALHASELGRRGVIGWERREADASGALQLAWPDVAWGELARGLQKVSVVELQAWARTTLTARAAGVHALRCAHAHTLPSSRCSLICTARRRSTPARL